RTVARRRRGQGGCPPGREDHGEEGPGRGGGQGADRRPDFARVRGAGEGGEGPARDVRAGRTAAARGAADERLRRTAAAYREPAQGDRNPEADRRREPRGAGRPGAAVDGHRGGPATPGEVGQGRPGRHLDQGGGSAGRSLSSGPGLVVLLGDKARSASKGKGRPLLALR